MPIVLSRRSTSLRMSLGDKDKDHFPLPYGTHTLQEDGMEAKLKDKSMAKRNVSGKTDTKAPKF